MEEEPNWLRVAQEMEKEVEHFEYYMRKIQSVTSDRRVLELTDKALCGEDDE